MLSSILIAIGLAMDSMAVAVSSGVAVKTPECSDTLRLSGLFGVFQCGMLLIGWALGISVRDYVSNIHHYIAFVLLSFIGIRMMLESRKESATVIDPFSNKTILIMAFATSVDALAAGVGLAVTDDFIISTAFIVGLTAFLLSALGVKMGNCLGRMFKKRAEIVGGAILTLIGLKILLEHLFA